MTDNPLFRIIEPDYEAEACPTVPDYGDIPHYENHHLPATEPHRPASHPADPSQHRAPIENLPASSDLRTARPDLPSSPDLRFAPTGGCTSEVPHVQDSIQGSALTRWCSPSTYPQTIALSRGCSEPYLPTSSPHSETRIAKLREMLDSVSYRHDVRPPEDPVVMSINGTPVAHAGNLGVIEGGNKAGKSTFYGAAIASIISPHGDHLGWESDGNPFGKAVVHFDSEQSRADHDRVIRRAHKRSGQAEPPAWLRSFCTTGWEIADARDALQLAISDSAATYGGIHSIWLDGGADFLTSVNDEAEANSWVRLLQSIAIKYACPVFVIIHLNPSPVRSPYGDKSRGHFGSQLDRKAETILRLHQEKEDGKEPVTSVFTRYARHAPITPENGPQFTWNPDLGMHTSVAIRYDDAATKNKRQTLQALADDVFLDFSDPFGMRWSALATRLCACLTIGTKEPGPATISRRINEMVKCGLIRKTERGLYARAG